jgi:thiol-disulfide isomerase/thioredoxin
MLTLNFYSAPWCVACKSVQPIAETACKAMGLTFKYIDVSYNGVTEENQHIVSLPTIEIRDEKNRMLDRRSGAMTKRDIEKMIKGVL